MFPHWMEHLCVKKSYQRMIMKENLETKLPKYEKEGSYVFEVKLPENENDDASMFEEEHKQVSEVKGEVSCEASCIDEVDPIVFVDDNENEEKIEVTMCYAREEPTKMIFDEDCADISLFETEVRKLEVEFDDDNLSYDECLSMMEKKNIIDEIMFA